MAASLFEGIVDWSSSILANIVEDSESAFLVRIERIVQSICNHFIRSILKGEQFTSVIVTQAQVAGDSDATTDSIDHWLKEGLGIHVRGLDKYRILRIVDCCEPGSILRSIDTTVIRSLKEKLSGHVSLLLSDAYSPP